MATREEFIERQHSEVRATLENLHKHQAALIDSLVGDENNEELKALLGEAEIGVQALVPILSEFDRDDVDPNELIRFAQAIEDWQIKEKQLAEKLG